MIPYRIIAEAVAVILIVALGLGLWYEHNEKERRLGAQECQDQVKKEGLAIRRAAEVDRVNYEAKKNQEQATHDKELQSLTPIAIPVILRKYIQGTSAGPGPSVPASTGLHTADCSAQPGSGERDIRPGIESFKLRYERALADARLVLSSWPSACYAGPPVQ